MKGIVLLSDGIDSPVAFYLMNKRMDCVAVHFLMDKKEKIEEIMKILHGRIYFIPYERIKEEILRVKTSYRCLICKRFMYRIAEKIANMEKADIIITGENLGQVASQTLDNLMAIEDAVNMPVVRPLIAMDKEEIIRVAKEIGTYEISISEQHRCPIAPKKPVTKAKIERVRTEEEKIDISIVDEIIRKSKIDKF